MTTKLKHAIRNFALRHGLDIRRVRKEDEIIPQAFLHQKRLATAVNPVIFDVGGNIGEISQLYRRLFSTATIHSFEPFPEVFAQLQTAMAGDANAHQHNIAIADVPKPLTLHIHKESGTNSIFDCVEKVEDYWYQHEFFDHLSKIEIPGTSIDVFCEENNIPHIDILKLDIQGAEYLALQGARRMFETNAIDVVYFEVITVPAYEERHKLHEYLALMDSYGFDLIDFYTPLHKKMKMLQVDLLFAKPDNIERVLTTQLSEAEKKEWKEKGLW